MSLETREYLNEFMLIGNCKHRPRGWHDDAALRQRLGLPDNHFDDPIPYQVVVDRLFNWQALAVPTGNFIPCIQYDDGTWRGDKEPEIWIDDKPYWISMSERQGIVRDDNFAELGNHSGSYRIHDYTEWGLHLQSNIIGDTLSILGAGLLRNGAQAFIQVALPETAHDDTTGLEFIPFIMFSSSLDGSIPTTYSSQTLLVVCDNTRNAALRQAESSGRIYQAKHTSRSLDYNRIQDVRQALNIIHVMKDEMMDEIHRLAAVSVNRKQTIKVLDIIQPLPDTDDESPRKLKIAENKRERLLHAIFKDPIGGAEHVGTALGLLNGVNTYFTHYTTVQGASRLERNMDKVIKTSSDAITLGPIKSGATFAEVDRKTALAIAEVCHRPELVSSN